VPAIVLLAVAALSGISEVVTRVDAQASVSSGRELVLSVTLAQASWRDRHVAKRESQVKKSTCVKAIALLSRFVADAKMGFAN